MRFNLWQYGCVRHDKHYHSHNAFKWFGRTLKEEHPFLWAYLFPLVESASKDLLAQPPCVSNGFLYCVKNSLPDKNMWMSTSQARLVYHFATTISERESLSLSRQAFQNRKLFFCEFKLTFMMQRNMSSKSTLSCYLLRHNLVQLVVSADELTAWYFGVKILYTCLT